MNDNKKHTLTRRVYNKTIQNATKKRALTILAVFSFLESFIFPIPPDLFMYPIMIARRRNYFLIATITTLSSVIGGVIGYFIGDFLFDNIGEYLIKTYHLQSHFEYLKEGFAKFGFWIIVLKGITPIPFKIITITCGVIHFDFMLFLVGATISRTLRFFIPAVLFYFFEDKAIGIIERHSKWFVIFGIIIVIMCIGVLFV